MLGVLFLTIFFLSWFLLGNIFISVMLLYILFKISQKKKYYVGSIKVSSTGETNKIINDAMKRIDYCYAYVMNEQVVFVMSSPNFLKKHHCKINRFYGNKATNYINKKQDEQYLDTLKKICRQMFAKSEVKGKNVYELEKMVDLNTVELHVKHGYYVLKKND